MSKKEATRLVINIINFQNKIQKRMDTALSTHGIGLSEYLVLNQLAISANQRLRNCDLAQQIGITPGGVTRLLNRMEKIGLVEKEKNPRDGRVSLVTFSKAGKQIFRDAKISFDHVSTRSFESFNTKQLRLFSGLLNLALK